MARQLAMSKRPKLSTTANPHFCTPEWILEGVRRIDPKGQIALDPCSNGDSIVDALVEWRGLRRGQPRKTQVDGLAQFWGRHAYAPNGRGSRLGRVPLVYVNPPFSRGVIEQWLAKCDAESHSTGHLLFPLHTVALVPARLSASWYKRYCFPGSGAASAVCQLGRRVRFRGAESPCPWEMSLVYWGPEPDLFALATRSLGAVYAINRHITFTLGAMISDERTAPLVAFYPQRVPPETAAEAAAELKGARG